ncbi:PdxA family dehydrogenase [Xenophilus azovorans]|uniref:PdxA family dehydrogenase n=1 Tax=Xenophilus azovorans TaxID=151755 RepID=UPI001B804DD3|nr:4-hydroxythreonine-4-phosphate dehydrogenase PdxA [Xenophilus azovorans]
MIGDPSGIGPEVVAKAWTSGRLHEECRPVLLGSAIAMEQVLPLLPSGVSVRIIDAPDQGSDSARVLDIIDSGALDPRDIIVGVDTIACGKASADWLDEADRLARAGALDATVMGPISAVAMQMAGVADRVINEPGQKYLLLASGALRIAHLTDHVPLGAVSTLITRDLIEQTLRKLDAALRSWGIKRPRIAVAGFNPHAKGTEEEEQIVPGIERARAAGILVAGPVSPDTVFRQCIEGQHDIVLAMYHDQGHIAIKTWGFSGNIAIVLGPPYPHVTVAHGTAYDIVGKGVADHTMVLNAILTAGSLAAGRSFPTFGAG